MASLDLDLVIAADQLSKAEQVLAERFTVERFPHRVNVADSGSKLRIQLQTDPRYFPFVERAAVRDVLGVPLPVARIEDVLQGEVWTASDEQRRASKLRKDLLDIERIIEAYPELRSGVPEEILRRLG